ncbi:hypothetical protein V8C43DRAFT_67600 [Trichoderma afarasin]
MGFYLLFRLQNGICFVLHIDLALGLSVQIFGKISFSVFRSWSAGPFAGIAPNAGNKRKCASNTNSFLLGRRHFSFLSFFFSQKCTMSFWGHRKIFEGLWPCWLRTGPS